MAPCVRYICCMLLIFCFPLLTSAFLSSGRSRVSKRVVGRGRHHGGPRFERKLYFKKPPRFQSVTVVSKHQSTFLECEAGGSPVPTVHWLKDGERIPQGLYETVEDDTATYEDMESQPGVRKFRLSSTVSRFYLDCPTRADEGEYTCVAETPYMRKTQSTIVRVEGHSSDENCIAKRAARGEPARVYMWTASRFEYEDSTVQFFCRASGYPEPTITWYDRHNNVVTEDDEQFSIAQNGDLIVRDITFTKNMGLYRCEAENDFGSQSVETFLYPTPRDDTFELPV